MTILRNLEADERAELEALRAMKSRFEKRVEVKVSQKGAVQINGLRRFPITLYRTELETILGMHNQLEQFIEDHADQLTMKGE